MFVKFKYLSTLEGGQQMQWILLYFLDISGAKRIL
jgi:hypothetical protein